MVKMEYVSRYDMYVDEKDTYTKTQYKELKSRRFKGMLYQDKKADDEEKALLARGVCPRCHMFLPTSGKCDCCE